MVCSNIDYEIRFTKTHVFGYFGFKPEIIISSIIGIARRFTLKIES